MQIILVQTLYTTEGRHAEQAGRASWRRWLLMMGREQQRGCSWQRQEDGGQGRQAACRASGRL